jgi:electron transfer flavoprotein beta subunit
MQRVIVDARATLGAIRKMPLKILVTAKRVEDSESKIKVNAAQTGIAPEGLKYKINPFDEIAVEEGLRLAAKHGGDVVVVSVGTKDVHEQLRHALAMGATKAIWVNHTGAMDQLGIAACLQKIAEKEKPDICILGKQAIDDDQAQVGQYLAEWMGVAQATFASKEESLESEAEKSKTPAIKLSADSKSITVVREVDGGLHTVECTLPAVVTTELRLNQPRYASLPGIMKAKSKPIEEHTPASLGVDMAVKLTVTKMAHPAARKAGIKVADVGALMDKLKNEAKAF